MPWRFLRWRGIEPLASTRWICFEVGVGSLLAVGDGIVYEGAHSLSLGSAWPIAGVLWAGVVRGVPGGAAAGVALGVARTVGDVLEPGGG